MRLARSLQDHKWISGGIGNGANAYGAATTTTGAFLAYGYGTTAGNDDHFTKIAQGTANGQRIANRIRCRRLQLRIQCTNAYGLSSTVPTVIFRFVVAVIKTPMAYPTGAGNGMLKAFQNFLITNAGANGTWQLDNNACDNVVTFFNPDALAQCDILCERVVYLRGPGYQAPEVKFVEIDCNLRGMYAEYGDTTGNSSNMYSNAITLFVCSNINFNIAQNAQWRGIYLFRYDE